MSWQPACLDPDELQQWQKGRIGDCQDCLGLFRKAMREQGRCNRRDLSVMGRPPLAPSGDERLDRRRAQWRESDRRHVEKSLAECDSGKLRCESMDHVKSSAGSS
jgi:hypothetical protein